MSVFLIGLVNWLIEWVWWRRLSGEDGLIDKHACIVRRETAVRGRLSCGGFLDGWGVGRDGY